MQYSTNYNLNKPQAADQFNIEHWNQNTDTIDSQMHTNEVDIAANKADISALLANLTTNKADETNSTYYKLMKLIYPVGSIYWSGNSTNPASLFGGTWVQIKDRFVWAKGDSDALNSTGGEKTHTLSVNEMPSHSHTFSGNSVTTSNGGVDHTHNFSGNSVTTSNGGVDHTHTTNVYHKHLSGGGEHNHDALWGNNNDGVTNGVVGNCAGSRYQGTITQTTGGHSHWTNNRIYDHWGNEIGGQNDNTYWGVSSGGASAYLHTHTVTASGSISGASAYLHTHTVTASGSISGAGGGNAHNNMPPYIVKYCWERTA